MSDDQRQRLQSRLIEVGQEIDRLKSGRQFEVTITRLGQLTATRDAIELALAQLDAAEAQRQSSAAQLALAEAENRSARATEDERVSRDDAAFWSRRFYTSLAVGNGVGFVTVASALIQHAKIDAAIVIGFAPITYFALGLTAAGLVPLLIWRQRASKPGGLWLRVLSTCTTYVTAASAVLFAMGLGSAVVETWQLNSAASTIAQLETRAEIKALVAAPANALPAPSQSATPAGK